MTKQTPTIEKMDEWLWGVGNTDRPNDGEMIDAIRAVLEDYPKVKAEVEHLKKCVEAERKIKHIGEQHTGNYMAALEKAEAEVERLRVENKRLKTPTGFHDVEEFYREDKEPTELEKAEAELTFLRGEVGRLKAVILKAHDELMGESWECPRCGHSESTSDMDVMELVLKPAALSFKESSHD